jgi:hypothetical protein
MIDELGYLYQHLTDYPHKPTFKSCVDLRLGFSNGNLDPEIRGQQVQKHDPNYE